MVDTKGRMVLKMMLLCALLCGLLVVCACKKHYKTVVPDGNYNPAPVPTEQVILLEEETTIDVITEIANAHYQYAGQPYIEVNGNVPFFGENEYTTERFEIYSPLDSLGRCGMAYANICPELMPVEERGMIGNIQPSGWHTVKYNDVIDGNYLYNRCHLIGYQLAGENDNERNLITGTRYLNVEGMLPWEEQVTNYVRNTANHVLYRVTPIFDGDNLVASGVLMEAASVENEDLHFCVYVFNVQPYIGINYATGDSWLNAVIIREAPTENASTEYILNTNSKRFHYPYCNSVADMKEKNKQVYVGTREEIIGMGYEPCGGCSP